MKKYAKYILIITLYSASGYYYAATKTTDSQFWNAEQYDAGNFIQFQSSLFFLQKNNIELSHKKILEVACGTGKLAHFFIENYDASLVHGFDSSHDMIEWAHKHYLSAGKNISFSQCCVENFFTQAEYDLATIFFSFHWFTDKQKALDNIWHSLKENGELFGTFSTNDIPQNPGIAILKQMMKEWDIQEDANQALARSMPDTKELKAMLITAHFDIIKCGIQENNLYFAHRKDIEKFYRPILMSRPFIQKLLPEEQECFFQEYIDRLSEVFQKDETGGFSHTMYMTIVHARKQLKIIETYFQKIDYKNVRFPNLIHHFLT